MLTSLHHPLRLALIALLVMVTASCSTTRKALNLETAAEIRLEATQDINPNSDGKAAPIVLQVIKLRDARQFKQEEFLNLFEDAKGRLGNDLIEITKLKELAPGEKRLEKIALTPDVKYLGILGEYIQYNDADAKAVIRIEPHTTTKATLKIEKLKVHFEE
ncbi:MAG: type VI secretion system lipoprotein TssJ [Gammaproteobacteria bacterium]